MISWLAFELFCGLAYEQIKVARLSLANSKDE
jgi:hypothetical protein